MTIAETRRKLPPEFKGENLLTLEVFSTLKNIDRSIGLGNVLKEIFPEKKSFGNALLEKADFYFWPIFADFNISSDDKKILDTQPDLVIKIDKMVLITESKYESSFGEKEYEKGELIKEDQLIREYKGAELLNKALDCEEFYVVCVVDEYSDYDEVIKKIPENYKDRIKWISWQKIGEILKKDVEKMDDVSKRCTKDLVALLEDKGLRRFKEFKKDSLDKIRDSFNAFEDFYEELRVFLKELSNSLAKEGISFEGIDREGTSQDIENLEGWVTTYIHAYYTDEKWKTYKGWEWWHAHLYVRFDLSDREFPLMILVGYSFNMGAKPNKTVREGMYEKICKYLKSHNNLKIFYFDPSDSYIDDKSMDGKPKDEIPQKCRSIEIHFKIPEENVSVKNVREKILKIRDIVNELQIYPENIKKLRTG